MTIDITASKEREEPQRDNSGLLASIIESAMDAIITINDIQRIVLFNAAAEKIFGCPRNEAIGSSVERFIPQRFRTEHSARVRKFGESGVTNRTLSGLGTLWGLRSSGEEFPIEASISKIESGGKTFFTVVIRDITERHRVEELVRESERRFRLVADTAPVLIWMSGTDKLCNYFNKPWLDFTGRSIEQELGNGWVEGVHPEDLQRCLDTYTQSFDRREKFRMDYRLLHYDGRYRWILDIGVPRFDQDHSFVGYIGVGVDVTKHKQAEETLRKSEERFRLATQAGKMYAYDWDVATDVIVRSPNASNVLGSQGEASLTRQQLLARIHPDDRALFNPSVSERTPEHPDIQMSYRMLRPDGSFVWLEKTAHAFFDEGSRLVRMIGMVADITERKQAEEALRVSEERLRLAQQAARIGSFERDVQTGRVTWAEGLESLYGLPPGSVHGKTTAFFNDLIHPADRERTAHLIQQALKTGQPTDGEWRAIWPDGSVHWIASRWQVLMDQSGEPSRVVGINMDITERKQAEDALVELNHILEAQSALLKSNEELLKIFVKNVPAAVAMLDREMRYVQVSDRWCTDYLPGREQILGRSHYELFPDLPERWKEVHRRCLEGEILRADDDRWDGQDGPHWARWEVRPWKTADGTVGGILIFAEDITRRKQMEEALSGMSRKLIEAQEQERARIARELHDDVSQRLAVVTVEIEQLRRDPSKIRSRLQELQEQVGNISNDIQALSHDLHPSKLEYLGVPGGMRSWCREFAERQKLEIDFRHDVRNSLPTEIGICLYRVLQEALHNAAKHSGVKRIEVQLHEGSSEIDLIVRDSGRGFDVAAVEQGKGLGLTSMRERVRLVNGTIAIESKPMAGTTIRVRIPFHSHESVHRAAG